MQATNGLSAAVYTEVTAARSNALRKAELRMAPVFAHVVAFGITYEIVAVLCKLSFAGSLLLVAPLFGLTTITAVAEELLLFHTLNKGTMQATCARLSMWACKLLGKVAALMTANLVARLVSSSISTLEPIWAALYVGYALLLTYSAGRSGGAI